MESPSAEKGPAQRWVEDLHRNLHQLMDTVLPILEEEVAKMRISRPNAVEALFEGFIEGMRVTMPKEKGDEKK